MISVVIPTFDSERRLLPTLASLVAGSMEGVVREVILADGGSGDGTAAIADAAGCVMVVAPAEEGARLAAGARAARGRWLLFLVAGVALDEGWPREARSFTADGKKESAGAFRLASDAAGLIARGSELAAAMRTSLGRPRIEQGLLLSKPLYESVGPHPPGANSHTRLLAAIGRRRLVRLRTLIRVAVR